MKVEIDSEERILFCDGLTCDPIKNYMANAHCGNCPIIEICNEFVDADLARIVFEGANLSSCSDETLPMP